MSRYAAPSRTVALVRLLQLGALLCFVGHGAFGIIGKAAWLPYFAAFGVDRDTAWRLMPVIGTIDIATGIAVLFTLRPALLLWMCVWTVFTACLRPIAGEPAWETLERAGNYGVPFALLVLVQPRGSWRSWFAEPQLRALDTTTLTMLKRSLAVACALLLLGHGALGVMHKPGLVKNLAVVVPSIAAPLTPVLGGVEIALALAVLLSPSVALLLFVAAWKLATESLFLGVGVPAWEVVERGGSYVVPLSLALVAWWTAQREVRPRLNIG